MGFGFAQIGVIRQRRQRENLRTGVYPLMRTLSFFFGRPPSGDVLAFSRWAAVQKDLIELHGFTPIR